MREQLSILMNQVYCPSLQYPHFCLGSRPTRTSNGLLNGIDFENFIFKNENYTYEFFLKKKFSPEFGWIEKTIVIKTANDLTDVQTFVIENEEGFLRNLKEFKVKNDEE